MREGILLEDALEEIGKHTKKITYTQNIEVKKAGGFCLAEDVYAEIDNPPFPRSPVDGYAVRAEDIRGAVRGILPGLGWQVVFMQGTTDRRTN